MKYLQLIPLAIAIAKSAEEAVPLSGKGREKFDFALDIAAQAYEVQDDLRANWKDQAAFTLAIGKAINTVVALLNKVGVFGRSAQATA